MKKVLFVAEGSTLAHVARPLSLAQSVRDAGLADVVLAYPRGYEWAVRSSGLVAEFIETQPPAEFARRLKAGSPLYDFDTLKRYVVDDLELFKRVRPDAVIGDFRLSLAVSARLAGIPYATISNAYWSPYYRIDRWPIPDIPLARRLPLGLAEALFNLARPLAFRLHARPFERLLAEYGRPSLGHDLRRVYTEADLTLYADIPDLFALPLAPESHQCIGPIMWAPECKIPGWWGQWPDSQPIAYLTAGSSGDSKVGESAAHALSDAGFAVLWATAGAASKISSRNIFVSEWLDGGMASRCADVVVCNGGSPTTQQAIMASKPVIGIASNLDQHLNMVAVEAAEAGVRMRADRFDHQQLVAIACSMRERPAWKHRAVQLAGGGGASLGLQALSIWLNV